MRAGEAPDARGIAPDPPHFSRARRSGETLRLHPPLLPTASSSSAQGREAHATTRWEVQAEAPPRQTPSHAVARAWLATARSREQPCLAGCGASDKQIVEASRENRW
jgi:hypothetical protein